MRKNIHTTIKKDVWLLAQINNVCWAEALEVGINVVLGVTENEEDKLIEKINKISADLNYHQKRLKRLREQANKQNTTKEKEEIERIINETESFKRANPLRWV